MVRAAKREAVSTRSGGNGVAESSNGNSNNGSSAEEDALDGRFLRSRYLNIKSRICDEKDDLSKADSDKFTSIFEEVERLHEKVQKPREQVADAEALLDITNTLVTSVKAHSNEGVTPTDFLNCLLRQFGDQVGLSSGTDESQNSIHWEEVGLAVSNVFKSAPGCCTMIGPMTTEIKHRKPVVQRKLVRPTGNERPEELPESEAEKNTDTDKNMATMFQILRKHRRVRLEALLLNRRSFAQTVENLFALSFLVKDGRAQITVDDKGVHTVGPRNAPSANAVLSGEVSYQHFVFRFDFKDWKLMLASVEAGEELMPHRNEDVPGDSQSASTHEETGRGPSTPIRKLSRNRGLVLQEQTVVEDSPEGDSSGARAAAIRKGKRKIGI
ncbi:non-structural maintenance of chromosomes element 4 homolog A-like [Ipomoea triloba]|uniref:non-structural maintenance of chromosomes element 4 homolog A-like n=1 Tax=Ipomoea triloba TaxID=35885 RepID=UPI00125D1F04|nr:non-structural maintenance of chromosomes element 4 homolog A-like [Ipomoea triloba]